MGLKKSLKKYTQVILVYTVHKGDARRYDVSNICSVHDKFFCDALVESGLLPDDNYKIISEVHYFSGDMDRDNPRVDVEVYPVDS